MNRLKLCLVAVLVLMASGAASAAVAAPPIGQAASSPDDVDVAKRDKRLLQHHPRKQEAAKPVTKTTCDLDPKSKGCKK